MIKQYKPDLNRPGEPVGSGQFEGWDRETSTFSFFVAKSWWRRIVGRYQHAMSLEIDHVSIEGRPFVDNTDIVQWLDECIHGCVHLVAFEHLFRKHPQAGGLLVTNLAVRFTDPGDLVMFKLRFANLTNKKSLQDYVRP